MSATKHDSEKPRLDKIPTRALRLVALVLGVGAIKYGWENWRKGMEHGRLIAAAKRHLDSHLEGEDLDPESGLPHVAHAACCLLFLLEYIATETGTDDRYIYNKE